jgi:hypothetical protein
MHLSSLSDIACRFLENQPINSQPSSCPLLDFKALQRADDYSQRLVGAKILQYYVAGDLGPIGNELGDQRLILLLSEKYQVKLLYREILQNPWGNQQISAYLQDPVRRADFISKMILPFHSLAIDPISVSIIGRQCLSTAKGALPVYRLRIQDKTGKGKPNRLSLFFLWETHEVHDTQKKRLIVLNMTDANTLTQDKTETFQQLSIHMSNFIEDLPHIPSQADAVYGLQSAVFPVLCHQEGL